MAGIAATPDLEEIEHLDFGIVCDRERCSNAAAWIVTLAHDPCGKYGKRVLCEPCIARVKGFCTNCQHKNALKRLERV